jgi:hypothetical protein
MFRSERREAKRNKFRKMPSFRSEGFTFERENKKKIKRSWAKARVSKHITPITL